MTTSSLPDRVQGGTRPAQNIIWWRDVEPGQPAETEDLTGATMAGVIENRVTGVARAIAGTLVVTDGPAGAFRWTLAAADVVEAGSFDVQITATFGDVPTTARTFIAKWTVERALLVTA